MILAQKSCKRTIKYIARIRHLWQNKSLFTMWAKYAAKGEGPPHATGYGAPNYPIASLAFTILEYRSRRKAITTQISKDRAAFAEELEAKVEAASQNNTQHVIFKSLHFYRCAKPTKRKRTGFVPLPSLQDKEGNQTHSYAQSRMTWQQHHAVLEAGFITTIHD